MDASAVSGAAVSTSSAAAPPDAGMASPATARPGVERARAAKAARGSAPGTAKAAPPVAGTAATRAQAKRSTTARTRVTPSKVKAPSGGYAKTAAPAAAKASSTSSAKSLEDKLFAYLKQYAGRVEKELDEQITGAKQATAKKSTGGGLMGALLGAVSGVPVVGELASSLGQAGAQKLLSSMGGVLLGGVASVIGTPALGAIVAQVGPSLIDSVLDAKLPGTSAATGSTSSKSSGTESEQIRAMEIQRLVTQLNEAMSAVSNVLKSMHETRMTAIQNIR